MANNTLRVYWRTSSSNHGYVAELEGSKANYTCSPPPGENSCDVANVQCGDVYHVVVAPLTLEGAKVQFCPLRQYSGMMTMLLHNFYCYYKYYYYYNQYYYS